MSKKQKNIFVFSIVINAVFIGCLIGGYLKTSLAHKELFYSEVQYKLVELDGLIEHQKENGWSEPNLVTTQLDDVLNGLSVATNSGRYTGWLSNDVQVTMERLNHMLGEYPHDELYMFSVLTQSDKEEFEDLQSKLQTVGLTMNMTVDNDWGIFIEQSEQLLALLEDQ